ncbi:sugar ABC transporter permease [Microbacterium aquimaris]|uniref:Xylose transport system permease protein XylH n=1 Tax=Microbacterium aquimaris TaxID=459816 RepID=A0ABU5N2G6_9MICO|nr:sugar ABC transporter permease [Microbacterium aquimaris]MDZ8160274.1 sugar ABC transporter permease [Microbacterium aquimaris]
MNLAEHWRRMRDGERPVFPIVVALVVIWVILGFASPAFWAPENLVNLSLQSVSTGIIALGVVIVLLIGQIDLSVGAVSGLAAAIAAVTAMSWGWPLAIAVVSALAVGAIIGVLYGVLIARVGLPGFVLTLAGLLIATGLQWQILGDAGSINLPFDSWLVRFTQTAFVPTPVAWVLVTLAVVGTAVPRVIARRRRRAADLGAESVGAIALKTLLVAVLLAVPVAYLSQARGVGWSVVLFVALVWAADILLRRTRWGRGIRAIGGDHHAARLAGVPVRRIVVSAFVACSTLAALGGVLAAGRLAAANQSSGGGELFLIAIAAAIVGGTSLYGGRGNAWSALVGILIIQSIANGLTLIDLDASARNIATGVVLVLAVTIDTLLSRRRRPFAATGDVF